jgi:hypothetical protein
MTTPLQIARAEYEHLPLLAPLFDAYRVFYQQPSDLYLPTGVKIVLSCRQRRQ